MAQMPTPVRTTAVAPPSPVALRGSDSTGPGCVA
jgi:hypothetical protein